jgi:hypothetical protein
LLRLVEIWGIADLEELGGHLLWISSDLQPTSSLGRGWSPSSFLLGRVLEFATANMVECLGSGRHDHSPDRHRHLVGRRGKGDFPHLLVIAAVVLSGRRRLDYTRQ